MFRRAGCLGLDERLVGEGESCMLPGVHQSSQTHSHRQQIQLPTGVYSKSQLQITDVSPPHLLAGILQHPSAQSVTKSMECLQTFQSQP